MNHDIQKNEPPQVAPRAAQFGLRSLLFFVAACSGLFAVMGMLGPIWSIGIVLIALMVAAHVAGNVIGTRLRDQQRVAVERPSATLARQQHPSVRANLPQRISAVNVPALGDRSSTGRVPRVLGFAGAISGALLGRIVFGAIDKGQFGFADWTIVILSFAVVGGFAGFMTSNFVQIGFLPAVRCYFSRQENLEPRFGDSQD